MTAGHATIDASHRRTDERTKRLGFITNIRSYFQMNIEATAGYRCLQAVTTLLEPPGYCFESQTHCGRLQCTAHLVIPIEIQSL